MAKKKNRSGRASSSRDKRKSEFSFNNLIKISSVIVFIVGLFFTSIFYGIIPNPFSPFNYLMSASFVKTDDNINFVFEGDVFSAQYHPYDVFGKIFVTYRDITFFDGDVISLDDVWHFGSCQDGVSFVPEIVMSVSTKVLAGEKGNIYVSSPLPANILREDFTSYDGVFYINNADTLVVVGEGAAPYDVQIHLPDKLKVNIPIKMHMRLSYILSSWFPLRICISSTFLTRASIDRDLLFSIPSRLDRFDGKCYNPRQSPCYSFSLENLFPVSLAGF
ncbi:MAG TPA: hypothetical protein PLD55_13835 [bacterium]|nr:hypothetical protein [bacterium]